MFQAKTDEAWEYYGKKDPYFGVLTAATYKTGQLTDETKNEFFATGERYIDSILQTVREHFDSRFRPSRVLDFGCGVGRLAIPLAKQAGSVVAVDVSQSMLLTAEQNAREQGLSNIVFVKGDDALSRVSGTFDFVHSFIVFQHIPPPRGYAIFARQINLLQDDGVGALHFTYGYAEPVSVRRTLLTLAQNRIPFVNMARNFLRGRPVTEPPMQMNEYDVNRLLQILHKHGCHDVHLRFTETSVHGRGFYGVILVFRKRASDVRAHA
jgi:SAM-dependent methyltransferase